MKDDGDTGTSGDGYPWAAMLPEISFIVLPLLVLSIVSFYKGDTWWRLIASPEWSFGSAVLVGQALVRLISAIASGQSANLHSDRIALLSAFALVFVLVPSLVVLALLLVATTAPPFLVWTQLGIFILSLVSFLVIGGLAHALRE